MATENGEEPAFQRLVRRGGCVLEGGGYVCSDPHKLQQCLQGKLLMDRELRQDFVASLSEYIQDPHELHRALLPMNIDTAPSDSLLRVVLNVPPVQTEVGELLLQQLAEAGEEADPGSPLSAALEVLGVCSEQVQREIIAFLPEIVVEEDHAAVVDALEELLSTDNSFVVPALSTFSNLSMEPELEERTTGMMLARFSGADVEDLPQLLRYLVQNSAAQVAADVVQTFRSKLHFLSASDPRLPVTDRKQKGKMAAGGSATLEQKVLDGIRSGLQTAVRTGRRDFVTAFLAELKAADRPGGHRPLDIWLLVMLHSFGGRDQQVAERVLRGKVLDGTLGAACFQRAVVAHEAALKPLFPSLMQLAASFVKASQVELSRIGGLLYKLLFCAYRDSYHQQEVLGALLASTGGAAAGEVTAALEVLVQLAEEETADLLKFASFIGMLLDYLANFTNAQLHLVFQLFSQLVVSSANARAIAATSGGSRIEDELHIVITKQLSSGDPRFKRIGIIGTVTHICRLSSGAEELDAGAQAERRGEAIRMLHAVLDSQMPDFVSKWLYNRQLDPSVMAHNPTGPDGISTEFENQFLVDNAPESRQAVALPGTARFVPQAALGLLAADGGDNPVLLNVAGLLGSSDSLMRDSVLHMAAQFRLMQLLEQSQNDHLMAINALLSCPVSLPPEEVLEGDLAMEASAAGRERIALMLFHAINWCREVANAFHEEHSGLVLQRLANLLELEERLAAALAGLPASFALPSMADPLGGGAASGQAAGAPPPAAARAPKRHKAAGGKENQPSSQAEPGALGSQASARSGPGTQLRPESGKRKRGAAARDDAAAAARAKAVMTAARGSMRALQPELLTLLRACAGGTGRGTQFAPTLYLMTDLKCKLDVAFAKQRPTFLATSKSAAPVPSGLGLSSASPEALIPHLQPCLPAVRALIDAAREAVREEAAGEEDAAGEEGAAATMAPQVLSLGLGAVREVLSHAALRTPRHQAFLRAVLEAFGADSAGASTPAPDAAPATCPPLTMTGEAAPATWTVQEAEAACSAAFSYFEGHMARGNEFDDEMSAVHILRATLEALQWAAASLPGGGGDAELAGRLRQQLSLAAGRMLECKWSHCPLTAGDFSANAGWKGRNAQIGELVSVHVRYAESPVEMVATLADEYLRQVDAGDGRSAVSDQPSLTGATLPTWCRALHEELDSEWAKLCAQTLALQQGRRRADPDAVATLVEQSVQAVKAWALLMLLVKRHEARLPLQTVAVKYGGRFIEAFMKTLVFWEAHWKDTEEVFISMLMRNLQKGTRVLQAVCGEGKSRRDRATVTKVPALKRTLERFIFRMKAFFHDTDHFKRFVVGNLKHKNLRGEEVASQAEPADSDGEEEEGEEERGEGEDEGEEGEPEDESY
eukprot:jgi/Tetstr1/428113/TSEL_018168.t1